MPLIIVECLVLCCTCAEAAICAPKSALLPDSGLDSFPDALAVRCSIPDKEPPLRWCFKEHHHDPSLISFPLSVRGSDPGHHEWMMAELSPRMMHEKRDPLSGRLLCSIMKFCFLSHGIIVRYLIPSFLMQ